MRLGGGEAGGVSRGGPTREQGTTEAETSEDGERARERLIKILTNKLRAKLANVFLPQIPKELGGAFEAQERLERNEAEIKRSLEKVRAYEADLTRQAEEMDERVRRVRELLRALAERGGA